MNSPKVETYLSRKVGRGLVLAGEEVDVHQLLLVPRCGMMNHLGEVISVRKLTSMVQRHGNSVPISGRPPCPTVIHSSYKKTLVELLTLDRVPPTVKLGFGMIEWESPLASPGLPLKLAVV
ncbi:hypothetical protein BHM03_00035377 [Ensete ventricosum]|nr:hypothetical protein BHM03_00035377 [Ensete ventricosum]